MKKDLAKDLYKFYRSGFRKFRNTEQSSDEREKHSDPNLSNQFYLK